MHNNYFKFDVKKWRFLLLFNTIISIFLLYSINIVNASNNEILVKYKDKSVRLFEISDLQYLLNNENVLSIEPNYGYQTAVIPDDKYFENQWYLKKIHAPEAWNLVNSSKDIVIAIIDSGVDIYHPDLVDNIWVNNNEIPGNGLDDDKNGYIDDVNGWDFINNVADPRPKFNKNFTPDGILHGTIVAGVAAGIGNNKIGISGVTWKAKIMPIKVLDDDGSGDTYSVIKAIDYAIKNGADIINFSFVGYGNSKNLEDAIRRAYEAGILIVAAAGNEMGESRSLNLDQTPLYPACHDGENNENMVIGVAATDSLDQKTRFSGFGFKCVDIAAPGISIFSTAIKNINYSNDNYQFNEEYDGYWSGTSMAVPMVSGALALVETINPSLSTKKIKEIIIDNSDNINRLNPSYIGRLGKGRLNVYKAAEEAYDILVNNKIYLVYSAAGKKSSLLNISDRKGKINNNFLAFDPDFYGGVNLATGDFNFDDKDEIIAAAGPGGGPHVRIFNMGGDLIGQFFAYDDNFRGGVNVAVGDVDGDGRQEIITGAGPGGGPQVRIFDNTGKVEGQFFAYDDNFRGGVNVAVGDVDGDGRQEIITGAGPGGGPQVRIFDNTGKVEGQFFAYDDNFRGGVNVAVGTFNHLEFNKKQSIVAAPSTNGGPHIRIFDNYANILEEFFAYQKRFHGGVNISVADIDKDGLDEIITGAGPGGGPHIRIFEQNGIMLNSFYGFDSMFDGGVNVDVLNTRI